MAKSHKFQLDRKDKPTELLFCLFTSILLHFILFIVGNYWLKSVASEQRRAFSQAIPIEYIEVPPDETKTPKQTLKRAANNSVGKGQVSRPNNLNAPTVKAFPPKLTRSTPPASSSTPPAPNPITTPAKIQPRKLVVAPTTTPPAPNPTTTPAKIQPRKLVVAPTTTPPVPSPTSEQLETGATPQKPQVQPALKSGAASRLGGPVSLSSRDLGSNYFAASPNSNRFNPDFNGTDARKDTDLGPYLKELQRQVRQQWIPEVTQSSRRSVLHFTINRSGQVSNLRIARTSGFNATDEAAVSAVKRAAPFIPLPTTYSGNNISIEFTFVINVYGELDLQGSGQN